MAGTLPPPPPVADLRALGIRADELVEIATDQLLWRVHRTSADHGLPWSTLRTYGPVLRFDPHPYPRGEHPTRGVWYGAMDVDSALAEAYQDTRVIDRRWQDPYLTGFRCVRPLQLLDLGGFGTGRWPTRVGGTFAMDAAPRSRAQRWARAVRAAHPQLDGLLYRGRFAGGRCLALFTPAADAFPTRPTTSNPLTHPGMQSRLAGAALRIGYAVV